MKVIINADDFGINQNVTNAIIECANKGLITSTTIMANGDSLSKAKEFALSHPEISFGVHFCLSEFDSLTKSLVLFKYGITDSNGRFIKKAIFKIKRLNPELRIALLEELRAQIEVIQSMGFKISHADSHHHVHTLSQLKDIFVEVLKEYGIERIRLPRTPRILSAIRHPISYVKYRVCLNTFKINFKTVDNFSSFSQYLASPRHADVIELMCHPGHPGKIYREEITQLMNNKLDLSKIQLISYNEL